MTGTPLWGSRYSHRAFSATSHSRGLSDHPITDKDSFNNGVHILNRTGLFTEEYKTWIIHGNGPSKTNDFISFETFRDLSVPASQHGYGMAATDDDASTPPLADAVSKFGTAHAATQESLRYNTAAMRGQLQMLCLVIGSGQPPRRWRLQRGRWRQRRRQPRQPPPVKRFENWNDCQTHGHGGDEDSSYMVKLV